MKNIEKIDPFIPTTRNTKVGKLTTLSAAFGVSAKGSISSDGKSLLVNYIYKSDGTYHLVYTLVDTDGEIQSFVEDDGILPTLFLAPDQENYVSVVPYHLDKELEVSIPIFKREGMEQPKGNRPFTGNFIGTSNEFSIFFDVDIWSDKKPDKLLAIEFKSGAIKRKHNIKVALPRNNKIYIANGNIHLLAEEGENLLHRQIDEKGNEIRRRKIDIQQAYCREVLHLTFENTSYLLTEEEGKIFIWKIDEHGNGSCNEVIDIGEPLYNTWQPVKISDDTTVTSFNGEFGNGWMTIKNEQLLEAFFRRGVKGYKNLLTNEVLEMEDDNLVISSINKTGDNSYAVVFYPMPEGRVFVKELKILNHKIG